MRKANVLIRQYSKRYEGVDPDDLTDEEWAMEWNDLLYFLDFENRRQENNFYKALSKAFGGKKGK